jgi:DNA-binding SARP family transcriptional activator
MVHLVDLIDVLSDAAFAVDGDGCIVAWSPGAQYLLGSSEDVAIGKRCGEILQGVYPSGEPLCTALCEGHACFACGDDFSVSSCLVRHQDGGMVPVRITSMVVPLEQRDLYPDEAVAVVFLQERGSDPTKELRAPPLRISTLGHFSLVVGGKGLGTDTWKRRPALTVLKCLVAHAGHAVHRERLIEYIWPDTDSKRGWYSLKVAVSFLRQQLQAGGVQKDPVVTLDQSYMLRSESVWIDAKEFEKLVAAGHEMERQERLDEALQCFENAKELYRGDFLEDDLYADWCARERERLRELYFEMLAGMAKCKAAVGDNMGAALACREALYRDQSRESFLRTLIECLARIDRADWAKPQLEIWQRVFTEEFDMVPKPEHLRLYQELIEAMQKPDHNKDGPETPPK